MTSFLSSIDIFGKNIQFGIFNKEKFKTTFGGILSLVAFGVIILFTLLFGRDFFYKLNPKILFQQVFPNDYEIMELTDKNFTILWRMIDHHGNPFNYTNFVYPFVQYFQFETQNTSILHLTKLSRVGSNNCSYLQDLYPQLSSYDMNTWMCLNLHQDNYFLGGGRDGDFYSYFQIILSYCPNGEDYTSSEGCTDQNALSDNFISSNPMALQVLYPQLSFSPNAANPLQISYASYTNQFSLLLQKYDTVYIKKTLLRDDIGWILTDYKNSTTYSYSSMDSRYFLLQNSDFIIENSNSYFYSIGFKLLKEYEFYNRSYMKIQDVLAVTGGFMKVILTIASIINYFINSQLRDEYLFSELFDYIDIKSNMTKEKSALNNTLNLMNINRVTIVPISNQKKSESSTNQIRNINQKNSQLSRNAEESTALNNIVKNCLTTKLGETLKTKKKMNFGFKLSIKKLCCKKCLNQKELEKVNLYEFSAKYLAEKMDITYYLRIVEIVNKMKSSLFNYHQNLFFDFLKKTNLADPEEFNAFNSDKNKDMEKAKREIITYFMDRISNDRLNDIDKKLLLLIDPNIKNFIS